jgi:5-methylcytosine-specific restriction endonuclease McrA
MNTRTKFTSIPKSIKVKVYERDSGCCIICGKPVYEENACCHFVPRSAGGLGIEQNIFTGCQECHERFDHSTERRKIYESIKTYLKSMYPDWNEESLIYTKGMKWTSIN